MKYLISAIMATVVAAPAIAQETTSEESSLLASNASVSVSTDLEGNADWKLGAELGIAGFGVDAGFTLKDRGEADADDYKISLGTGMDLGFASLDTSVNYAWGATSGADLIGRGDGNTWGDVTMTPELAVTPGIIGGEYVWVGAEMDLASAGEIDLGWGGANYGFGYKHELNDRASVFAEYGWSVDVVDDDDDATVNDWTTTADGLKVGVGFKF
tara:strand:+ start:1082 stop:1723 length:642 start_codon:yes stop_codon:yes gene_type:complete